MRAFMRELHRAMREGVAEAWVLHGMICGAVLSVIGIIGMIVWEVLI